MPLSSFSISSTSATVWGETQCVSPLLFCRRLRLISHPTSCQLERDDFLEIVQCFEHLLQGHLLLRPALPHRLVQRPKHQVFVADDFWLLLGEDRCEYMLHVILVSDE